MTGRMGARQNINARDTFIEPGFEICLSCPRYRCEPDSGDCPLRIHQRALGLYTYRRRGPRKPRKAAEGVAA